VRTGEIVYRYMSLVYTFIGSGCSPSPDMMHPAMRTKDAILSELAAEQAKLASLDHTREQARAKIEALRSELAVAIATPALHRPFSAAASTHAPDTTFV